MIEIPTEVNPPREIHKDNVMYWEAKSKGLLELKKEGDKQSASLLSKAKKFLDNNCIILTNFGNWLVTPIENYNKTTYYIMLDKNNKLSCSCQGFGHYGYCSHILAVRQFEFIKSYNEGEICL